MAGFALPYALTKKRRDNALPHTAMRSPLTDEKKLQIVELLKQGFSDKQIAEKVGQVSNVTIGEFRKSLGITREALLQTRRNCWVALVKKGETVDRIAEMYQVKPTTVQQTLWRQDFSFAEVKRESKEIENEQQLHQLVAKFGGIEAVEDLRRTPRNREAVAARTQLWVKLLEAGYDLEVIAQLYGLQPRSIQLVLWQEGSVSFREIRKSQMATRTDVPLVSTSRRRITQPDPQAVARQGLSIEINALREKKKQGKGVSRAKKSEDGRQDG